MLKNPIPYPPWGTEKSWAEANWTMEYLVARHLQSLHNAREIARTIHSEYQLLLTPMETLSNRTCPPCQNCCCHSAKPYFDFRDLIFLHLQNTQLPEMQTIKNSTDRCRYISSSGCTLNRIHRPWICTWYICPTQHSLLTKDCNKNMLQLPAILKKIQLLRWKLEDVFIQIVS